jgi:carbon storage regulator
MLILTRRSEQSILIGDEIEVMIVAVRGKTVQFAIRAPREIPIYRKEIYERIRDERERTASRPSAS